MNVKIEAESTPGKGSELPLILTLEAAPIQNDTHPNNTPTEHEEISQDPDIPSILLVEDYSANILVATTFLEVFGYRYSVARNGKEAIEKFKEESFNVILMDIQMHDMDGITATQHIREYENTFKLVPTPIIAMTAHALTGDREKFLEAGMNDYISKPFNPHELQEKLAQHITINHKNTQSGVN